MNSGTNLFAAALTTALLLGSSACSSSNNDNPSVPTVLSTSPANGAVGVPPNAPIVANFSEPMNPATLGATTFLVTVGPNSTAVPGTVIYSDSSATFWPTQHLDTGAAHTATITRRAQSADTGTGLGNSYSWNFETGSTLQGVTPVDLGGAGTFAILAKAGISTVPASSILGDIGVSPAAATAITMFSLTLDASGLYSTSTQVTGNVYAADYAPPTPQNLTTAVLDMQAASTDAAARAPDVTELNAGSINSALTLVPGVYKWGTGLNINADVTLTGSATDVWIFQIAQNLVVASATDVALGGDALPQNVFWQVSGLVDLGTTATLDGVILSSTAVTLGTGAAVNGRVFAQTAVSLDQATVVEPAL